MLIFNVATGRFVLAFDTPGIIAHSEHLWNILGMYAVGFAAVLAGGCPLRQLILAGRGSSDSAVTVLGMFVGAALCHNFWSCCQRNRSGTLRLRKWLPGAVPHERQGCLHLIYIIVCFVIAFTNNRKEEK